MGSTRRRDVHDALRAIVSWYARTVFGSFEGPGTLPFYCDTAQVGAFAVPARALAGGHEDALFRLLVVTAMFQGQRDVVVMRRQRSRSEDEVAVVASLAEVRARVANNRCPTLSSIDAFESCDVGKSGAGVDCRLRPGAPCQVKDATRVFNRMGDMGRLPSSILLHTAKGGFRSMLAEAATEESSPTKRALNVVERVARVHRVGRKLATMFVSALSAPALAPGLTPWFPEIDGNELVVVDTNVARAIDRLRPPGSPRTYPARERWLREQSRLIDLRRVSNQLPRYSPRIVQQALYAFGSKSNRTARGDDCASTEVACEDCVPQLCPFARKSPIAPT